MRATHGRPLRRWNANVLPRPLGAQPECERGDLRGARVDVHAVKVVLKDERRRRTSEVREVRVVVSQRPAGRVAARARCLGRPGLFVDRQEKVEAVEQEVAGAAGRIEDAQVTRVLPLARSRLLLFAPHEVTAPLGEIAAITVHLEPRPPKRVVHEKLDDVSGREKLVANGQLATVARRLGSTLLGVPHGCPFFLGIEELVNPPDGLVLSPHLRKVPRVQSLKKQLRLGHRTDAVSRRSNRTLTSVDSSSNRLST